MRRRRASRVAGDGLVLVLLATSGVVHAAASGGRTRDLTGGNQAYALWNAAPRHLYLRATKVTSGTACVDATFDWLLTVPEGHVHHDARVVRNCHNGYTHTNTWVESPPGAGWNYAGEHNKTGGCYLYDPSSNYRTGSNVNADHNRVGEIGCYPTSRPNVGQVQADAHFFCADTYIFNPNGSMHREPPASANNNRNNCSA